MTELAVAAAAAEGVATTAVPRPVADEAEQRAEEWNGGVVVRKLDSDLPGFDRYRLVGIDDEDESVIGDRLYLTVGGGRRCLTFDETQTADLMWALAGAVRGNRRAATVDPTSERGQRYERLRLLMIDVAGALPLP